MNCERCLQKSAARPSAPPAQEQFRLQVCIALRTIVSLGAHYDRKREGNERTDIERKPLIAFARQFASNNGGKWGDVRGMSIWSKVERGRIRVAIRNGLFGELRCCQELASLTYDQFTDLCVKYDIGQRCKVKGGNVRAIILNHGFLEDIVDSPADEPTPEGEASGGTPGRTDRQTASPAHACENKVSGCPDEEQHHEE